MALVVEDGSGKADADSYLSVADADALAAERGSPTAWTALTSPAKESALRYATEWLDGKYVWAGTITYSTQALGWPRTYARDEEGRWPDSDVMPERVKVATYEVALVHAQSALNTYLERGGAVRSEKVGPIDVEYFDFAAAEPALPHVDRIIRGLGRRRGTGSVELYRG